MALAAITPAQADCPALPGGFCFSISGAAGSDGHGGNNYLGGDGQWGDYGSSGIVTLPTTVHANGSAAATVASNGGDGGWGDRSRPSYGWGGNGGPGGGLHVHGTGTTVINNAGYGIDIWARGGNGGPAAINAAENDYDGRDRGSGAAGGVVVVDLSGITTATQAGGVRVNVRGGNGANGAIRPVAHNPRGGAGGNGGQIIASISGNLTTASAGGDGAITLSANGGTGGNSAGDGGGGWPRSGGDGGLGGTISLNFSGTIQSRRYGIHAESRGGGGGSAAQDSNGDDYQTPGGYGSAGGNIALTLGQGRITITGDGVDAVFATSTGGNGGHGGSSHPGNPQTGKAGGNGGSSGSITIDSAIGIETRGTNSIGINAIVAGGLGGAGGSDSGIIYSKGGAGGRGGAEQDLRITNSGAISTFGIGSHGIVAQSLGGGGASAGSASGGIVSIGGKGGNAGSGGVISLTNYASVQTKGDGANGLMALSIGGGGGIGGGSLATPGIPYGVGVSLGGSGGAAGDGGAVTALNADNLTTLGKDAAGIVAHSIGGGGGNANQARLIGVSFVNVAIGGKGGAAGHGGNVQVINDTNLTILTKGAGSTGIDAKSIGGGGGNAGGTYSFSVNVLPVVSVGIGGDATHGSGTGNGGAVKVENEGNVTTEGAQATAILAHSIGGSGGKGGPVDMTTAGALVNVATAVGGDGGGGGSGGSVTIFNGPVGIISTLGTGSIGLDAQSIGGGGGAGGAASSDQLTIGVAPPNYPSGLGVNTVVGGAGGSGGAGGAVIVTNNGGVATAGDNATAIFAKSIGGGGGSGGSAIAHSVLLATGASLAVSTAVGGKGGSGGDGGTVTVDNVVDVTGEDAPPSMVTGGAHAAGIAALSVGGGGGSGGNTMSLVTLGSLPPKGLDPSVATKITGNFSVAVGGTGGGGGRGGTVTVSNGGSIVTRGDGAYGVQAQSTGGGGGSGGNAAGLASSIPTLSGAVNVGGKGGSGNIGGAVSVTNSGTVITGGADATAILAQSIGGGGGSGGNAERLTGDTFNSLVGDASALGKLVTFLRKFGSEGWDNPDFSPSVNASVSIGGSGGSGNHGGTVSVSSTGPITTSGAGSAGIEAQSVGGGGGKGGHAYAGMQAAYLTALNDTLTKFLGNASSYKKFSLSFGANIGVGGSGGAGGDGGAVTVTNSGAITTAGHAAAGIVAQSIGGGGGNGGGFGKENGDLDVSPEGSAMLDILRNILPFKLSATTNVNIGGSGGAAGTGGAVTVTNGAGGSISTKGDASDGILAQSIGGGGGNGAHAAPTLAGATLNLTFQHGGKGGGGGAGGLVTVDNAGTVTTGGAGSSGVLAQSIGGGGGKSAEIFGGGGNVLTGTLGGSGEVKMGADGATGAGGDVTVTTSGSIATRGVLSHGVLAQSISNGGGAHLFVLPKTSEAPALAPTYALGATGGSGTSHGGTVKNDIAGTITTSGGAAFGVLAQSIGNGGGYAVAAAGDGLLDTPTKVTLGASASARGDGGAVGVTLATGGLVATEGRNAIGVLAQSIGGGGGVAALTAAPGLITLVNPSNPAAGAGGAVSLAVNGQVQTMGDGAVGVLAQSIGGGGGLAGDMASASYDLGLIRDGGTGGSGAGGHVTVNVTGIGYLDGRSRVPGVVTHGANAPAILAISLANGGALTDQGILARRAASGAGDAAGAITISVDKAAAVTAYGANSPGIYAISRGEGATGPNGGDINVSVGGGSSVRGGSGPRGAAIVTSTTGNTTITNAGTIASLGGVAIVTSGPTSVTNAQGGTLDGDVRLAVDTSFGPLNTIVNNGDFSPGTTIFLGKNGGVLTNSGYMDLTAPIAGQYDTTRLTGQFVQTASGTTIFGLDFRGGKSDVLSVSGATQFGGEIEFDTRNPLKGYSLPIAHFDHGVQGFSAKTGDLEGLPISYTLRFSPDGRDLSVSPQGNFARAGATFASDQANLANYLQALWDSGHTGAAPLFTYFARLKDASSYAGMLGGMANDSAHSRLSAQAHHSYGFFNSLMSCPYFADGSTQRNEGECVWGRVTGNRLDRGGSRDDSGYRALMSTYQIGAQKQIAPNWFLGGSLSYMAGDTKSDGSVVATTSHTVSGGLALKRQVGPWLFAAGLRAGYESNEMKRQVLVPGFAGLARSEPQFLHVGARLRAAYEFAFPNWYLRPLVDFDLGYAHQQAYRESGAGLFNLSAQTTGRANLMVTPALEIGGRIDLPNDTILRPYATLGVSFLAGSDWTARMQLSEFAASGIAPFRITTGAPDVYGNLTAGLELQTKGGFELRAEYSLRAADRYTGQTASLRAALRF
ncbi:hypothetical protein DK26_19570 [Bosea sp. WAO]|uniref:autotransporter outer membrane beta-barrel domain-containing protein n=1 Tax=Bosea sp. WAO TaxID=406341 RepID=UPI000746A99D|nr:autotransporter outer membrane beta-barrel domain-containing protein [Bosea sp. WAO]KUL93942.1 hypothetical protein DK26_19570 [Bosea sp. WAO]